MMRKGTNVPLTAEAVRIEVAWRAEADVPDVAVCALLLADGQARTDDDLVSAARPHHPSDAVHHIEVDPASPQHQAEQTRHEELTLELPAVEPSVGRIVVAASTAGAAFSQVPQLCIRVLDRVSGGELARFDVEDAGVETAYLLGEVYRREGAWKFRAVGQGYAHGIAGLTVDFGVRPEAVEEIRPGGVAPRSGPTPPRAPTLPSPGVPEPPSVPTPPSVHTPQAPEHHTTTPSPIQVPSPLAPPTSPTPAGSEPPDATTPAVPPPAGARPGRVTLTKERPAVSLAKQGGTSGAMRVNLNWQRAQRSQRAGWRARLGTALTGPQEIDLDLGALWELTDGRKGVVQALGNSFGSFERPPYIALDGDDRTGAVDTGENLTLNLDHVAQLRRVLVFVTLYEGAESFAGLHATVTLQPQHGAPVDFALDECTVNSRVAALALLTQQDGELVVQREARYLVPAPGVSMQRAVDQEYGWGMRWTPGRK